MSVENPMILLLTAWLLQDVEKLDCDSTTGWTVANITGGPTSEATLTASGGSVLFRYDRAKPNVLLCSVLLTDMKEIRLSLKSDIALVLALGISDRDGAGFHAVIDVKAGKLGEYRLKPSDFKINEDSAVKKEKLDPRRLGGGFILLDAGLMVGAKGKNVLAVDAVSIERSECAVKTGTMTVIDTVTLSESTIRDGDIVVKKGGRLRITSPRFVLKGNVTIDEGEMEISGGAFSFPQRYNHERKIKVSGGGKLLIENAHVDTSGVPLSLNLADTSSLEIYNSFSGGLTCDAGEKCRAALRGVDGMVEFIVGPGFDLSIADTKFAILWLVLGPNFKGKLTLPPMADVADFTAEHGLRLRVKNVARVFWSVVSTTGADGKIEQTQIYGCGLHLENDASLKEIHNGSEMQDQTLGIADRKLRFVKCGVRSWTIYPSKKANVTVDKCTIGECLAFQESKVELRDSTCDGTGGYIGAENKAHMKLVNCKATCIVVARDEATLILENCEIFGDVRATGRSTVRLVKCKVTGKIEKEPGATLVQE